MFTTGPSPKGPRPHYPQAEPVRSQPRPIIVRTGKKVGGRKVFAR